MRAMAFQVTPLKQNTKAQDSMRSLNKFSMLIRKVPVVIARPKVETIVTSRAMTTGGGRILCLIALFSSSLYADEVVGISKDGLSVLIRSQAAQQWKPKDRVCLESGEGDQDCGAISELNSKGAIIKMDVPVENSSLSKGSEVTLTPDVENPVGTHKRILRRRGKGTVGGDDNASNERTVVRGESKGIPSYNITLGADYLYPQLGFQFIIDESFTLGLLANYFEFDNTGVKSKLAGALLTIDYFSNIVLKGFWTQFGIGGHSANTHYQNQAGTQGTFSVLATAGWHWSWKHFNLGIAGGIQYFSLRKTDDLNFNFQLIHPVSFLRIGYSF